MIKYPWLGPQASGIHYRYGAGEVVLEPGPQASSGEGQFRVLFFSFHLC